MFFFARSVTFFGWLRRPSRLKMNSLRSALTAASPAKRLPAIRAKENIRYELAQTQNVLTQTGLLMEGLTAHRAGEQPSGGSVNDSAIMHESTPSELRNCSQLPKRQSGSALTGQSRHEVMGGLA
jgi:hypothetical protein